MFGDKKTMEQGLEIVGHPREAWVNTLQPVNHRVWDKWSRDRKGYLLTGQSDHGIEPKGRPPWELELMEIGDTLLVHKEVRPFDAVYNYVKSRATRLGRFFTVERQRDGATLVTRTATPERAEDRFKPVRLGEPGQPFDWGVIEKPAGSRRWRWPFKEMELGDVFRVDPGDVDIEAVRDRAYRFINRHFEVTMDGSWIKVQRVSEPRVAWEHVKYGIVRERVAELFEAHGKEYAWDWPADPRMSIDKVDFPTKVGATQRVEARLVAEMPKRTSYVFEAVMSRSGEYERFALDMDEQGFTVTRVAPDETQHSWDQRRLAQNPFA